MGQKELARRYMNLVKKKLFERAERETFKVYSNESVIPTDKYICVISFNEYELGEPASSCDLTSESYYVEAHGYEEYFE